MSWNSLPLWRELYALFTFELCVEILGVYRLYCHVSVFSIGSSFKRIKRRIELKGIRLVFAVDFHMLNLNLYCCRFMHQYPCTCSLIDFSKLHSPSKLWLVLDKVVSLGPWNIRNRPKKGSATSRVLLCLVLHANKRITFCAKLAQPGMSWFFQIIWHDKSAHIIWCFPLVSIAMLNHCVHFKAD